MHAQGLKKKKKKKKKRRGGGIVCNVPKEKRIKPQECTNHGEQKIVLFQNLRCPSKPFNYDLSIEHFLVLNKVKLYLISR